MMKRELLKELGLEDSAIESIMKEHGKAVEKAENNMQSKSASEIASLKERLAELEQAQESSMTAEERAKAAEEKSAKAIEAAGAERVKYQRLIGRTEAKALLTSSGMDVDSAEKLLDSFVVDDVEETIAKATSLAEVFKAQTALAAQRKEEELLEMDRPPAGDSDGEISAGAQMATQYSEQFKGGEE